MLEVELFGGPRDGERFALDHRDPEDAPRYLVFAVHPTPSQQRAWLKGELDPTELAPNQLLHYPLTGQRPDGVLVYAYPRQAAPTHQ